MPRHDDDDIDNIMSTILQRQRVNTHTSTPPTAPSKPKTYETHKEGVSPAIAAPREPEALQPARKGPRIQHKTKRSVKISIVVIILVLLIGGPVFVLRKQIQSFASGMFTPSPFKQELVQAVDFPLYYPTSLPKDYKIEMDSITEAEKGVIVYAISDNTGKRITLTMQKEPTGINIDTIYASLKDVYELETSYGTIKVGRVDSDNMLIGSVVTGGTWLLFNTPNGNIPTDEFNTVLTSLKKG